MGGALLSALLLTFAVFFTAPPLQAAVLPGSVVSQAEGRAPVIGGRSDLAFQQALDEAFRKNLLAALRAIAPERQSPQDFETWQDMVLSRAADFIGAYRILSQEEKAGFLELAVEVEIYRERLAQAARVSTASVSAPAIRLMVLVDPFPVIDPAADEEIDAGSYAITSLEAEFARRGAVIIATTNRSPWRKPEGAASEENRAAHATAEGKRLQADAVLVAQVTRSAENAFTLSAQIIAVGSEATLGSAREDFLIAPSGGLEAAFGPAARQIAATLGTRLAGLIRAGRLRSAFP